MAKNANAKSWALQIGELARRWSDQPFDLTGPSAPTIAAFGSPTQTTVGVQVTVAAVDNRTGVVAYQVEISTQGAGGPFTVDSLVSVAQATAGFNIDGLNPSNDYWVRLKGKDGSFAGNIGSASNVIQQTTSAPAPNTSWWPNWPIANIQVVQGNVTGNLLDTTQHPEMRKADLVVIQGINPIASRVLSRVQNIDLVQAPQIAAGGRLTRFVLYMSHQQALKDLANDGNSRVNSDLINDAINGHTNWWLRRVTSGAQIEATFDPTLWWFVNTSRSGVLNSLAETYQVALAKRWKALLNASDAAHNLLSRLAGVFYDDTHWRMQAPLTVTNGTVVVTDPDFEQNGVSEDIKGFGAGANQGCRKWSEGHLDHKAAIKSVYGQGFMYFPNSARVSTDYYDSQGVPPLPLSAHPAYGQLEIGLHESVHQAGLGISKGTSTYSYNGGGSLFNASRFVHIHRLMLCPDNQAAGGRSWVVVHSLTIDRTLTQDDYSLARLVAAFALLQEKCAVSVSRAGRVCFALDELILELGNPIGTRSLGTMNESTAGYTQRTANFSNGVGRFYWHEYEKGLVLLRTDNPTVAVWPNGVALSCTLPPPGSGKKWQRLNAANYTNPVTGLSMSNQSPTLNDGTDAGATVSLRPYEAIFLRRVDS